MVAELIIAVALGWYSHSYLVSPAPNPLIEAECVELQPPSDDSFVETTMALKTCVSTYKRCQQASLVKEK